MWKHEAIAILKSEYAKATKYGRREVAEALDFAITMLDKKKAYISIPPAETEPEWKEMSPDKCEPIRTYAPYAVMRGE